MSTYIVDPLNILTMGLLSGNALTILSNGFITIEEEIIEEDVESSGGGYGGPYEPWNPYRKEKKKKKKITVKMIINNKEYIESIITDNILLNVKDIKIDVDQDLEKNIKIKIILPDEKI